jgi:hypothetical protein
MPDETAPQGERRSTPAPAQIDSLNPYQPPASLEPPKVETGAEEELSPDSEQSPSPREDDAARAFKSAILGILFCPLQLYTLWLLLLVVLSDEPLRPRYFWYAVGAAAVLLPYLLLLAGLLFLTYAN